MAEHQPMVTNAAQPTGMRKWLERLALLQRSEAVQSEYVEPDASTSTDETQQPATPLRMDLEHDAEVAWRAGELLRQLSASGPILPLVVRPDVPYLWQAPSHCSMCGDARETGQRFICRACQCAKAQVFAALWS